MKPKFYGVLSTLNENISLFFNFFGVWNFQYPREASSRSRIFLVSLLVYMCIYLWIHIFVARLLAKRKSKQTRNLAHILPSCLSKNGFFSIKSPWWPLASKNCRVTLIFPHISSIVLFFVSLRRLSTWNGTVFCG